MKEFRTQLDALGRGKYLLSFDGEPGASEFQYTNLGAVAKYCNYVDLMAYDYAGPWQNVTGFVAPLYTTKYAIDPTFNVDWTVDAYLAAGVPANKILIGIPFYAYGWTAVVDAGQHGQFEVGTAGATQSYSYIVTTAMPVMQVFRDNTTNGGKTATPWLFDGSSFWTYDDEESIAQKMEYVQRKGLGGAFAWETSGDLPDGDLGKVIYYGLHSNW